jgi:tRNA nucleotidyltransferase (CCA-adding enzyme)
VARVRPHLDGDVSAVGGVVRDAVLGVPHGDEIDLVVEGEAIPLAGRLGRALGARVVTHGRFGTAALELPHGGEVDLVSARSETYPAPGALPVVGPGTLADDLARRDFTVNAIAVGLSGRAAGLVADPHGGLDDIAGRTIRSVRAGAFAEDPSRLVRAARYAARLGFALAPDTAAEARAAAPDLDPASARVGDELRRLLSEDAAGAALDLLRALGVPWIAPAAAGAVPALDAAATRLGPAHPPRWALRLGAALTPEALARAAVPGWARGVAREVMDGPDLAGRVAGLGRASAVDGVLRARPPAALVGALAAGAEGVATWWERDRDRGAEIGGADLTAAGVPPGPAIGRALAAVRAAVLDGRVGGREDQLDLALRVAGERP